MEKEKPETKKAAKARQIAERLAAKEDARIKRWEKINANPIATAVAPMKEDAIERAELDGKKYIEELTKVLEDANWDINAVAPYPDSYRASREKYRTASAKRQLFGSITAHRPDNKTRGFQDRNEPLYVDICPEGVVRFIDQAKSDAHDHYQSFVCKLVRKIGDTTSAELHGNHVWSYSLLTVTLASGEEQEWKTQQIVNRSVYGKLFNQWPSRKVKS